MESAPDMDDLLDEMEESILAVPSKNSKIPFPTRATPTNVIKPTVRLNTPKEMKIVKPENRFPPIVGPISPQQPVVVRPMGENEPSSAWDEVATQPQEQVRIATKSSTTNDTNRVEARPGPSTSDQIVEVVDSVAEAENAEAVENDDYDEMLRYLAENGDPTSQEEEEEEEQPSSPSNDAPNDSNDDVDEGVDSGSEDSGADEPSALSAAPDDVISAATATADELLDAICTEIEDACRNNTLPELPSLSKNLDSYYDTPPTNEDRQLSEEENDPEYQEKQKEDDVISIEIGLDDTVPIQEARTNHAATPTHEKMSPAEKIEEISEETDEETDSRISLSAEKEESETLKEVERSSEVKDEKSAEDDFETKLKKDGTQYKLQKRLSMEQEQTSTSSVEDTSNTDTSEKKEELRSVEATVIQSSKEANTESTPTYAEIEEASGSSDVTIQSDDAPDSTQSDVTVPSNDAPTTTDDVIIPSDDAPDAVPNDVTRERSSSEESSHGLETAIEGAEGEGQIPEEGEGNGVAHVEEGTRFQSIATFHDLGQESDAATRLTESERMLGKQKPFWIPDSDCDKCMLCTLKFSLLLRRHHCRACGRVLCGACCSEKAPLLYMKEEDKKHSMARVCTPCFIMLERIEDYEKNQTEESPLEEGSSRVRGVLKTRQISISEDSEDHPGTSTTEERPEERRRTVMFRDGVKPGSTQEGNPEEKSTTIKPKKKSRKRSSVIRRIAELHLEDELLSVLPSKLRPLFLIVRVDGQMEEKSMEEMDDVIEKGDRVEVVLKKNLTCHVQIWQVDKKPVWSVSSRGFSFVGLDEIVFLWEKKEDEKTTMPVAVLHRIAQIFSSSCDSDLAGVRRVSDRLHSLSSSPQAEYPLTKNIYLFRPTCQPLPPSLPLPHCPFLVVCLIHDDELPWLMACPNRVLLRIGHQQGVYPIPLINKPNRRPVFTKDIGQTVLKMFTDFRNWSYRLQHIPGSTVSLVENKTTIQIPYSSKSEMLSLLASSRSMLAFGTSISSSADGHLVCEQTDGTFSTRLMAKGNSREVTATSFVIIDAGLKSSGELDVSILEDGIAIRLQPERFESLLTVLADKEFLPFSVSDRKGADFRIEWVEDERNSGTFEPRSAIDGLLLADKYQYGLSLERAITSVLQVTSVPDHGVRLSHVYNLRAGRLQPDEEPKIFSIAEMIARECTAFLEPYLEMLINMEISSISVRVQATPDTVEYDVSPWLGMEEEQMKFRQSMDQLLHVFYNIMQFMPGGFYIELTLSFVSVKSLPIKQ